MTRELMHLIKLVSDNMIKMGNKSLKPLNLTASQASILNYLYVCENNSAPLKSMEKDFGVSQATLQGTVARLEKKGLVSLENDMQDKRIKHAVLTEDGQVTWLKAKELKDENDEIFLADLSETERETLETLLMKIYRRI